MGVGVAKEFSLLPDPPIVILVTAYDYFTYARTALRFGVFDYLLKPASTEDILGVFWRALHIIAERRKEAARRRADQTVAVDIQKALYADICKGLGSGTINDEDVRRLSSFSAPLSSVLRRALSGGPAPRLSRGWEKAQGKSLPRSPRENSHDFSERWQSDISCSI